MEGLRPRISLHWIEDMIRSEFFSYFFVDNSSTSSMLFFFGIK